MKTLIVSGIAYILLNIFVMWRINTSFYLREERRKIHKLLIWFIPFIGPLLIFNYWTKSKSTFEVMTKEQREKKKGNFYESGVGLDS